MSRFKFYTSIAIVGTVVLGSFFALSQTNYSLSNIFADNECVNHVGNHYAAHDATIDDNGNEEYWVCCKCHKSYNSINGIQGKWTDSNINPFLDVDYVAGSPVINEFLKPAIRETKFLYKIGNGNAFNINNVFKNKTISSVSFTSLNNNQVSLDKTDLTKLKFSGAGAGTLFVNTTVGQFSLNIEVVDAINATSEVDAIDNNVVLLSNISVYDGSVDISNGHFLFGNGYTISSSFDGCYLNAGGFGVGLVNISNNGRLENTKVIAPIYPNGYFYKTSGNEYLIKDSNICTEHSTKKEDGTWDRKRYPYQKNVVSIIGDYSSVVNCYLEGARNNIYFQGGTNTLIKDTYCASGALSNINLCCESDNTLILDNVTTNQFIRKDSFGKDNDVYGFGILVGGDGTTSNPNLVIKNNLKQLNWANSDYGDIIDNSYYASLVIDKASELTNYHHKVNNVDYFNLGVVCLNSYNMNMTFDDNYSGYKYSSFEEVPIVSSAKGQVSSFLSTTDLGDISSEINVNNYSYDLYGDSISTIYATYDNKPLKINYDSETNISLSYSFESETESTFTFDPSKLKIFINGFLEDEYILKNENDETISSSFVISENGITTLNSSITESRKFNCKLEQIESLSFNYSIQVNIVCKLGSIPKPSFVSSDRGEIICLDNGSGTDWTFAYNPLKNLKVKYYSVTQKKVIEYDFTNYSVTGNNGKLNGTNNFYTISNDDYELTITTTNLGKSSDNGMPIKTSDNKLYFTITTVDHIASSGSSSRTFYIKYEFKDKVNAESEIINDTKEATIPSKGNTVYTYSEFINGNLSSHSYNCVCAETKVLLIDGTCKEAGLLRAGDVIASFNHETGKVEPQTILHNEDAGMEKTLSNVIHLKFSNNSTIKVISEHGFFDYDLMKYVYITEENYNNFIGHSFASIVNGNVEKVTLDSAEVKNELVSWCSPTTAYNLNIITEGILSMPGGIEGMFNYFEFDEDLKYNSSKMAADIEQYGLYTFEEFSSEFVINEYSFDVYNGKYLKVALGKGLITKERINYLLERYGQYTM